MDDFSYLRWRFFRFFYFWVDHFSVDVSSVDRLDVISVDVFSYIRCIDIIKFLTNIAVVVVVSYWYIYCDFIQTII